jgi:hypothetical protein
MKLSEKIKKYSNPNLTDEQSLFLDSIATKNIHDLNDESDISHEEFAKSIALLMFPDPE